MKCKKQINALILVVIIFGATSTITGIYSKDGNGSFSHTSVRGVNYKSY